METPQSERRVTRSQTRTTLNNIPTSKKNDETEHVLSKQRNVKPDRTVLIDITNDSPIVGLAMKGLGTPSSMAKNRYRKMQTPGSGEALLRGQVKNLLNKVEEEAEFSKLSFENRPFLHLEGFVNSPLKLLAPTPTNTPNLWKLSFSEDLNIDFNGEKESKIDQGVVVIDDFSDYQKSLLTEFSDSSEKSRTEEEQSDCNEKFTEEDDASVWSIQVNASTRGEDEDYEDEEEDYEEEEEDEEEGDFDEKRDNGELVDELCEGLRKISVQEKKMPEFLGKHIRFVYNSEDEIEGEEEVIESSVVSPSILRLNGLPIPEGKHLRFLEEEEE